MKIFVDTNVLLDIFMKDRREELKNTSLFSVNKIIKEMEGCVSTLTIPNISYIMRKETKEDRCKVIKYIMNKFEVINLNKEILIEAMETDFKDYEDSIQYVSAKKSNCEAIVTRNKKDFETSTINVFTPEEFLEFHKE